MRRAHQQARACGAAAAVALLLLAASLSAAGARAVQEPAATGDSEAARPSYHIDLDINFNARTYEGTQTVRWVNRDDRPTSVLYFHLYPNLRPAPERGEAAAPTPEESNGEDEPRLEVTWVGRAGAPPPALPFTLEDGGVTLRVQLNKAVAPGEWAEVALKFKGRVPEIGADETSLPAHVIQQVGAALRDTREVRRARDLNFSARGVMLLGAFHPVLAVRDGSGEWQRRVEPSVSEQLFTEPADYRLVVRGLPPEVSVYSTATRTEGTETVLAGAGLRHLPVIAGRGLRVESRVVEGVTVRSVYRAEHEKTGRRVLEVACEATRVYTRRFGPLPAGHAVGVAEAPLVAGHGGTEFSGLAVIASAFYVDFDSPSVRNLPVIVREQRASVEESLEFAVAQGVARQWWGAVVGSDPARRPVLDEGLAHWSALLYVSDAHGEERARAAMDDQLRGVYQIYRTFGGEDLPADRPAREYRNSFQYAAIVVSKGSLMLVALRQLLGDERFFRALRAYYEANRFEVAELEDLRAAFVAEAALRERRLVTRTFSRWLTERRGDEDIGPPNPQLAAALGIQPEPPGTREKDRNAFSRLGRFFWRQMTRIR